MRVLKWVVVLQFLGAASAGIAEYAPQVPPERLLVSPGNVDGRTGRFTYNETDIAVGVADSPSSMSLSRVTDSGYVNRRERFAPFSHNWEIMITESATSIMVPGDYGQTSPQGLQISVLGAGVGNTFRTEGQTLNYVATASTQAGWLERTGNSSNYYYTYIGNDGTRVVFRPFGTFGCVTSAPKCAYAASMTKPDGRRFTFNYDLATSGADRARLRSVISNVGYAIIFEYYPTSGNANLISKACIVDMYTYNVQVGTNCPAGVPTATYEYVNGMLSKVVKADGREERFTSTYVNDNTDYSISFFKGSDAQPYLINHYDLGPYSPEMNYRVVKRQNFADGLEIVYSYIVLPAGETSDTLTGQGYQYDGQSVQFAYGRYKKPRSNDESLYFTPSPERVTDELGRVTSTNFCVPYGSLGGCNVQPPLRITDPELREVHLSYDSSFNVIEKRTKAKPGSGLPDIVETASYVCNKFQAANCTDPVYVIDANGGRTDLAYFSHGAIRSRQGPAVGGQRQLTRWTYAQRYAYIRTSQGTVQATSDPVWTVSTMTECRTGSLADGSGCVSAADEVVTSYEYGAAGSANALRVTGVAVTADGQTLRTCYGYDALGRKISETKPAANVSVCP